MKASHIVKIIKVLESCKTIEQHQSWFNWAKKLNMGRDSLYVWSAAEYKTNLLTQTKPNSFINSCEKIPPQF